MKIIMNLINWINSTFSYTDDEIVFFKTKWKK